MDSNKKKVFVLTPKLESQGPGLVVYELQMFLTSVHSWRVNLTILQPSLSWLFANARLEVTLVHARILLDFFEHPPATRKSDDILSADMGFPAKRIKGSRVLRENINKRLAHLTYTRTKFSDAKKKPWPQELFHPLLGRCGDFLSAEAPNAFIAKHAPLTVQAIWADLRSQMPVIKT